MDDAVRAAMVKWPDVPACYDWLSLDARGGWRLQGAPVRHAGLSDFLSRNYGHDDAGNWYSQNGPQRVFVSLVATPWVLRLTAPDRLTTHSGIIIEALSTAFLDASGRVFLEFIHTGEPQIGLVCDQDLPALLTYIETLQGKTASDNELLTAMEGQPCDLWLRWQSGRVPLTWIDADTLPQRYRFTPHPTP